MYIQTSINPPAEKGLNRRRRRSC